MRSTNKQPLNGVVMTLLGRYVNDPSGLTMHASYMITAFTFVYHLHVHNMPVSHVLPGWSNITVFMEITHESACAADYSSCISLALPKRKET